jgi:hypothetical protein
MNDTQTTQITHISWGKMEVTTNGKTLTFKDCKVWLGGATAWDWTLTGTRHLPGIQPADTEEILAHQIEVMILLLTESRSPIQKTNYMDDQFINDKWLLTIISLALTILHGRYIYLMVWKPDEYKNQKSLLGIDITPKFIANSRIYSWFNKALHILIFILFLLLFSILILDMLNII